MKLFMVLLGCRPAGRHTEQHDVFFGIAEQLRDLVPEMQAFWKGSGKMHVDGWREVQFTDGHSVTVKERGENTPGGSPGLFFINLGGYKKNVFEEFHYKMLIAANDLNAAIAKSKKSAFFLHTGHDSPHVDDKYGVDADDAWEIKEILSPAAKEKYFLEIAPSSAGEEDPITLGFFRLHEL